MDRSTWLADRQANAEAHFDLRRASTDEPDDDWITPEHLRFIDAVVESCPPAGLVLDAACGTGTFIGRILDAGRTVIGVDQSAGMLVVARRTFPSVTLEKTSLQALGPDLRVDGVICVGAMEFVSPEDWPAVLGNLRRAASGGAIYLSVEQIPTEAVSRAYADLVADGLPAVLGETLRGGGYHFYPTESQVATWLADEGLTITVEARTSRPTYGYWHLLLRAEARIDHA
jgi:cyclopropane fatty-acyl-phospholipid synthase-like methyltransferase